MVDADSGTMPQRTARAIMREAVARDLVPGDRLASEPTLMKYFEVSRSSLREALRVLSHLGGIEVRTGPGGGARMAHPRPELVASPLAAFLQLRRSTYRAVVEARLVLEPAVAALAASRCTDDDLAAIGREVRHLRAARGTPHFTEAALHLSRVVAAGAGNDPLHALVVSLTTVMRTARWAPTDATEGKLISSWAAAEKALLARDPDGARSAVRKTIQALLDGDKSAELTSRVHWSDVDVAIRDDYEPKRDGSPSWEI